jgi:hypothetical protein
MKYLIPLLFIFLSILLSSCENNQISSSVYGIGPVTKLELNTLNDSLMNVGKKLFDDKCSQCHTMEYKNIGPDISDILAYRKPEWIVNFMLNKEEMLLRDSLSIITKNKYESNCGAEITNKKDALALLEYFRIYQLWLHEFNTKYL